MNSRIYQNEIITTVLNSINNLSISNELKLGNENKIKINHPTLNNYLKQKKKSLLRKYILTKGNVYPQILKSPLNRKNNKINNLKYNTLNNPKDKSQRIFLLSNSLNTNLSDYQLDNNYNNLLVKNKSIDIIDLEKNLNLNFPKINYLNYINSPLQNYNLFSEKNNKCILQTIKYYLNHFWNKKYKLISDFFKKNRMYNMINDENIDNFSNYIKRNFENIIFERPMKEIILEGIKYNYRKRTKNKSVECKIINNFKTINNSTNILNDKYLKNSKKIKSMKYNLIKDIKVKNNIKNKSLCNFKNQNSKIDNSNL